jgi:hypothetical protein
MESLLALLLAAGFAIAAEAPSLSGRWDIYTSIADHDSNMSCTFAQKDAALRGTCNTERGIVEIGGKVDGDKVSWSYQTDYNGSPLTVKYDGTISERRIKGRVEVPEYGASGEFTANAVSDSAKD